MSMSQRRSTLLLTVVILALLVFTLRQIVPAIYTALYPPWEDLRRSCNYAVCGRDPVDRLRAALAGNDHRVPLPPLFPGGPAQQQQQQKLRIAIISYFKPSADERFLYQAKMAHHSQQSRRLYAARHGYDVIWEDESTTVPGKTAHWGKLVAVAKWLPYYDWVWWLDVDTLVMNHSLPLEWLIATYATNPRVHLLISRDRDYVNSGSMLLRSSAETIQFFRELIQTKSWDEDQIFEQAPINDLVIRDLRSPYLVERGFTVFVPPEYLNAGPPGWCVKMYGYEPGVFIVHFPGFFCERGVAHTFEGSLFASYAKMSVEAALGARMEKEDYTEPCCWFKPVMQPALSSSVVLDAHKRGHWKGQGDSAALFGLIDPPGG
jgi:hypothetical protein